MNDWEKDFHQAVVKRMDKNMKIFARAVEEKNYAVAFTAASILEKTGTVAQAKLREGQRKFDWANTGMNYNGTN